MDATADKDNPSAISLQPSSRTEASAPEYLFYHWDHLGTVRLITDDSGAAVSRHDYEPFGVEIAPVVETAGNTHQFTGHERDKATGYDYMHARFYGSSMGRFLRPDPLDLGTQISRALPNPQAWNLYTYVNSNPVNYNDPTGMLGPMTDWNTMTPKEPPPTTEQDLSDPLGSQEGQEALEYYADVVTDPDSSAAETTAAAVGGFFSSLWTPDTAYSTAALIVTSGGGELLSASKAAVDATAATTDVVHYTNAASKELISESGTLRAGSYVTKASEIPKGAGAAQIESKLEIAAGKGDYSITVRTPSSNLTVPENGSVTSGGAWQRQLKTEVPIDPTKFLKTR